MMTENDNDVDDDELPIEDEPSPYRWPVLGVSLIGSAFTLALAAHTTWTGVEYLSPPQIGRYVTAPLIVSIIVWLLVRRVNFGYRAETDVDVRAACLGSVVMSSIAAAMLLVLFAFWAVVHYNFVR